MIHDYLSTSCLHGRHDHCKSAVSKHDGGPKIPARCKWCPAKCRCDCHRFTGGAVSKRTRNLALGAGAVAIALVIAGVARRR